MSRIAAQILILADEDPGLSTLELALLERGANVLRARSESAVETLAKMRPDLVVVDPYRLAPRGLTLIESAGSAIVALLPEFSHEQIRRALAIGAQDYLTLPIEGNGALDAERLLDLAAGATELRTPRLQNSVDRLRRQVQELTDRYVRQCRTNDEAQDVFYLDLSRMMTIFDNIMDGILFTDTEGQVTLMNPVAEDLLGVKAIFAIGKRLGELGLREDLGRQLVEDHRCVLTFGTAADAVLELDDADDDRFLKLRTTIVLDYKGACAGVLSVVKDVSAEIVAEQMRNRYLSIVSHELRTPLTGIKSFSTMLSKGVLGALNTKQKRVSDAIREQTQRLEYEVDKLISLGRIESGDFALDREPVQLQELLDKVVLPFVSVARDREIEFEVAPVPARICLDADREDLRRAVRALVENAVKFTPDGGRVEISSEVDEDAVTIHVRDNGPGIHGKHHRRIFEKFFQVEDPLTRQHGGAGLGLHVAQAVAKAHGGCLELSSELGQGSDFRIRLPRVMPSEGQPRAHGDPNEKNVDQADSESGRKEQRWNGQS